MNAQPPSTVARHGDGPSDDHAAIRRLLARYCQHLDNADLEHLVALWTEDGEFNAVGSRCAGRPAIRSFLEPFMKEERSGATKHLTMNSVIEIDADTATALSDFLVIRRITDRVVPARVGQYHDVLARSSGGWRIRSRTNVSTAWFPPEGYEGFGDWPGGSQ
jgi:uncharacterized protein (TIGR02246 family)